MPHPDIGTLTITFVLSNFSLSCLVLGLLVASVLVARKPRPLSRAEVGDAFLSLYCLLPVGVGMLYNFVMHVFFSAMIAEFIGWPDSPFQYEVGYASLGFGVVGLLAFRGGSGLRVAAVVGPACFLLGAAGGHVYQMVHANNFSPGNAGSVFWTDIFIPLLGFLFLYMSRRSSPPAS